MKTLLRSSAFAACLALGVIGAAAPAYARVHHAHAHPTAANDMMRTAQTRLSDLGFYSGAIDGKAGPATRTALKDFQSKNNLPVSGKLTPETYAELMRRDYKSYTPDVLSPAVDVNSPLFDPGQPWRFSDSQNLKLRYGTLTIDEERGGDEENGVTEVRYTLSLNGLPLIRANRQPNDVIVTDYELKDEDALVATVYRGESECAYRNYLVTIHPDGKADAPREIGNCSESHQARVANEAVFLSFPGSANTNGWIAWDVWRYEKGNLIRL